MILIYPRIIILSEILFDREEILFDIVVVGSGNGACGFLNEYLKSAPKDKKILVLEQGRNYFFTSDITHQNNWSKSFSIHNISSLHNTVTSHGRPIISGRANSGRANKLLAENISRYTDYWDILKAELDGKLNLPDHFTTQTDFSVHIKDMATSRRSHENDDEVYAEPSPANMIANVSSLDDDFDSHDLKD
jgi:hypothetical protein